MQKVAVVAVSISLALLGCLALDGCSSTTTTRVNPDGAPASEETVCVGKSTCESTPVLRSISGDSDDGGVVTATGTTSEWIAVKFTEDISSWTGRGMKLNAVLTPPADATYRLRAYFYVKEEYPDGSEILDASARDCKTLAGTSTTVGGREVLDLAWGEPSDGGSANGSEDGRTIAFEVIHLSGGCGNSQWSLAIRGN